MYEIPHRVTFEKKLGQNQYNIKKKAPVSSNLMFNWKEKTDHIKHIRSLKTETMLPSSLSNINTTRKFRAAVFQAFFRCYLNLIHTKISYLYTLKSSENLWFSDVFRGYRNGGLALNEFKNVIITPYTT